MSEKIPDSVLLKMEREENGKLKSYIQELEHKIKKHDKLTKGEKKRIKEEIFYKKMQAHIDELTIKNEKLMSELIALKNK